MVEFMRDRTSRAERTKYLRNLLEYVVTDGLEDAYADDKITLSEKNELYAQLAGKMKLEGLLPRKASGEKISWKAANQLVIDIETRRNKGLNKPVKIPGEPPPQEFIPEAKTVLGSVFRRHLKSA